MFLRTTRPSRSDARRPAGAGGRSARAARAALLPAAAAVAVTALAAGPAAATEPRPEPGTEARARQVTDVVTRAVDLALLQPACGQEGAVRLAVVNALGTLGIEAKATLPRIDLGPLGSITFGEQRPGKAIAVHVKLLPNTAAELNLKLGEKTCPPATAAPSTAAPSTPAGAGQSTRPSAPASTAAPEGRQDGTARPAAHQQAGPELAETGGNGAGGPILAGGAVLLAGGGAATYLAMRRRAARGGA